LKISRCPHRRSAKPMAMTDKVEQVLARANNKPPHWLTRLGE
jgi:hypothetical protein